MKKVIKILVILLIFISGKAQDIKILYIDNCEQEKSNWCWAASTQMIIKYYDFLLSQCEIAEIARVIDERNYYNHYPNSPSVNFFGPSNCCEPNAWMCNKANRLFTSPLSAPGSKGGINAILDSLLLDNSRIHSFLSLDDVKGNIILRRPFIIAWGWKGTRMGHAIICKGFDNQFLFVNDPGTSNHRIESYDWVVGNSNTFHEWQNTLVMDNSPNCGKSSTWFLSAVTTDLSFIETDFIEFSSVISNNANVDIIFGKECILNCGFEIVFGSSLTITPDPLLICN